MNQGEHKEEVAVPITWTRNARRLFAELVAYLQVTPYSFPADRSRDILKASEELAYLPRRYPVRYIRNGKEFRRIIVKSRFFLYYIYFPPRAAGDPGRVSIRGVRHAARKRPFATIRDSQGSPCTSTDLRCGSGEF